MIAKGRTTEESITMDSVLSRVSEATIARFYLRVTNIPSIISSPLRADKRPSFSVYSPNGINVRCRDLSNGYTGGLFNVLMDMWGISFNDVLTRVAKDLHLFSEVHPEWDEVEVISTKKKKEQSVLECKIRDWRKHDIAYWGSYGITVSQLEYADVFPISHKIVTKDGKRHIFAADMYAYAYIERKDGVVTIKVYQPFNQNGFKWTNKHDCSVLSLWTKIPDKGDILCICSSVKDALCLWSNTGIPSISTQGEGYSMSSTAISELKSRFKKVYILFDNDKVGLEDGVKLAAKTGFKNVVLPSGNFGEAKDIAELYHRLQDKEAFNDVIMKLFV